MEKTSSFDFEIFKTSFPKFDDDLEQKILSPLSSIREFESKWIIEFDLPLVSKENITVSFDSTNTITIEAKLSEPYCDPNLEKCEFEYFKKTVTLPGKVDGKNITAKFLDGILSITVPKVFSGTKITVE